MSTPYLNRYRHGEFLQYMKDVVKLVDDYDTETLLITEQKNALDPLVEKIDEAYKKSQASTITQELIHIDNKRDNAITGLRSVITGYTYHFDVEKVNAAKALLLNLDAHGSNIQRLSYQEETATIDSIVHDWEKDDTLVNALTLINLTDWKSHLSTTNQEFSDRYIARVEEYASNTDEGIAEIRENTQEAYRKLIEHIKAHATLGTTTQHTTLLNQINVLATEYNQLVSNRTNSNSNSEGSSDSSSESESNSEGEFN